jgi:thiamine-phosphate pyrophosphorylase
VRGIYAIIDLEILANAKLDPIRFAHQILEARPAALQLRAKNSSARDVLALLRTLAPLCKSAGVSLVNNDRIDLAIVAGCDMVHLGQDDAPIEASRQLSGKLGVGLSTHTPEQLARALESRPAYVAFGPIFETSSKRDHEKVVGLDGLVEARRVVAASAAPKTPLVAIGGITAKNAANVLAHADAIAMIGALVGSDGAERMRAMRDAIGPAR